MDNEEIICCYKSYDEIFDVWKNSYFKRCPVIPLAHRMCVERWSAIFHKVPEGSYLKPALYDILSQHLAGEWGTSLYLEKLSKILPVVERLISNNCFEDASDFAALVLEISTTVSQHRNDYEHYRQTLNARSARSSKNELLFHFLGDYLLDAYYKWRPPQEEGKPNRKRALLNKNLAAKSIFKEHTEKIKEIFEAQGYNYSTVSEYSSEFVKLFDAFIEKIKTNPKVCEVLGYVQEKRAPRSQVSKQRSRLAALKNRTK